MKAFKLDTNGDRIIENGKAVIVTAGECLAQRLTNAIRLDKGSWFLDTDLGIEWFDILGEKTISTRAVYSRIKNILLADSEVDSIVNIDLSMNNKTRTMTVSFTVTSIYGEITGDV